MSKIKVKPLLFSYNGVDYPLYENVSQQYFAIVDGCPIYTVRCTGCDINTISKEDCELLQLAIDSFIANNKKFSLWPYRNPPHLAQRTEQELEAFIEHQKNAVIDFDSVKELITEMDVYHINNRIHVFCSYIDLESQKEVKFNIWDYDLINKIVPSNE
jgi:hypothetical protein